MNKIILKPKHDAFIQRRHPWIFSGAIGRTEGEPTSGETVEIINASGQPVGFGAWSPQSQISVRMWTFAPNETIDEAFFRARIERAIAGREWLMMSGFTTACRLINAESDGLPGLVVDLYNEYLVCQFNAAGVEYWKDLIIRILADAVSCKGIYERSDTDSRSREGLEPDHGLLWGEAPPEVIMIREGDIAIPVSIATGHKTGFYLDQRDNRAALAGYCPGKSVLNAFSYTGGFGLWALQYGAEQVIQIDSSAEALELAKQAVTSNSFDEQKVSFIQADVFKQLRTYRDAGQSFDIIVLDPPKFAQSASQVSKASRGYKDINLLAIKLLNPGGILFTFSCSGHIDRLLFQKIVAGAAADAGRDVNILRHLGQPEDHPISLAFPEGEYLKGLICRVW